MHNPNERNLCDVVFRVSNRFPYTCDENGIVTVFEAQNHPLQRFFRKLRVNIPEAKKISMDAYGSFVFQQIDGKKTVREIGDALEAKFGDEVQPLYERLSPFLLHIAQQRRYIEEANAQ